MEILLKLLKYIYEIKGDNTIIITTCNAITYVSTNLNDQ